MKKYPSVTIRVDQDLLDAIRALAKELGVSTSRFIREALEEKFDRDLMKNL